MVADWAWQWLGPSLQKSTSLRSYYPKVRRYDPTGVYPSRTFTVGDTVTMKGTQNETWVAHLLELFQVHPGDDIYSETAEQLESDSSSSKLVFMRCTIRWFYGPSDVTDDVFIDIPPMLPNEVYFTDYVEQDGFNEIVVLEGRSWLFPSKQELKKFVADPSAEYEPTADILRIVRCFIDNNHGADGKKHPKHHIKTKHARKLFHGELQHLISNPTKSTDMYIASYKLFTSTSPASSKNVPASQGSSSRRRRASFPGTLLSEDSEKSAGKHSNDSNTSPHGRTLRQSPQRHTMAHRRNALDDVDFDDDEEDDDDDKDYVDIDDSNNNPTNISTTNFNNKTMSNKGHVRRQNQLKDSSDDDNTNGKSNSKKKISSSSSSDGDDENDQNDDTPPRSEFTKTGRRIVRFTREEQEGGSDYDGDLENQSRLMKQRLQQKRRSDHGVSTASNNSSRAASRKPKESNRTRKLVNAVRKQVPPPAPQTSTFVGPVTSLASTSGSASASTPSPTETLEEAGAQVFDFINELNKEVENEPMEVPNAMMRKSPLENPAFGGASAATEMDAGNDADNDDDDEVNSNIVLGLEGTRRKGSNSKTNKKRGTNGTGTKAGTGRKKMRENAGGVKSKGRLKKVTTITIDDDDGDEDDENGNDNANNDNNERSENERFVANEKAASGRGRGRPRNEDGVNVHNLMRSEEKDDVPISRLVRPSDNGMMGHTQNSITRVGLNGEAKGSLGSSMRTATTTIKTKRRNSARGFMPTEKQSVVGKKLAQRKKQLQEEEERKRQEREEREAVAAAAAAAELERQQQEELLLQQAGVNVGAEDGGGDMLMNMTMTMVKMENEMAEQPEVEDIDLQEEQFMEAFDKLSTEECKLMTRCAPDLIDLCTRRVDEVLMRRGAHVDSDVEERIAQELIARLNC